MPLKSVSLLIMPLVGNYRHRYFDYFFYCSVLFNHSVMHRNRTQLTQYLD